MTQEQLKINEEIEAKEVRLIDDAGGQVGITAIADALRMAEEKELDLVEVAPAATPPVCRIMNFGKYKYEQQKKETQAKKKSHGVELKELRLGRSIMVEQHDIEVKSKKAREILAKGNRLQVFLQLKGREIAHSEIGVDRLNAFATSLMDVAKLDQPARRDRRRITLVLTPIGVPGKKKDTRIPEMTTASTAPVDEEEEDYSVDEIDD